MGSKLAALQLYSAHSTWLVTGTPFSTSLGQLSKQAELLGHFKGGVRVMDMVYGKVQDGQADLWCGPANRRYLQTYNRTPLPNEAVVEGLRKVMIRHTKAMRIGGEVALALPDADCETVWLDMSADERLLYRVSGCADGQQGAPSSDQLLRGITYRMRVCAHTYDEQVVRGDFAFAPNRDTLLSGRHYLSRKGQVEHTVDAPSPLASYAEATAAFLRLTEKRYDRRAAARRRRARA